ncbi:hypothetical protein CAI16_16475 [Virgibacillus dokdonensis]|uniref:4'-phosphopantetheinyl transferase domain-containing protein n=1 Tax=Virgibacillus dokdonensis TaxID=302167 RepID=A0A3E0WKM7_9BACI|nr:4'-phosphopantetheinyl transferase superfamily protein [Virgibacillus dokdonensis]RFA32959.1 hypothetical protein CAI16_16475 [Virgibacillus dokdonensis]
MIGIDLLEYERFKIAVHRSGRSFLNRILRGKEMEDNREIMWGTIFSAKESFIKLVGGMPTKGSFQDIEIKFDSSSTFSVETFGTVNQCVHSKNITKINGEFQVFKNGLILTTITANSGENE